MLRSMDRPLTAPAKTAAPSRRLRNNLGGQKAMQLANGTVPRRPCRHTQLPLTSTTLSRNSNTSITTMSIIIIITTTWMARQRRHPCLRVVPLRHPPSGCLCMHRCSPWPRMYAMMEVSRTRSTQEHKEAPTVCHGMPRVVLTPSRNKYCPHCPQQQPQHLLLTVTALLLLCLLPLITHHAARPLVPVQQQPLG